MCGRYTFASPPETVADHFRLMEPPVITPRYNVAPGQAVAVVARDPGVARPTAV